MTKMKDSDILEIWRKHQEVHAFANELLNIERKICAEIADKHEKSTSYVRLMASGNGSVQQGKPSESASNEANHPHH